MKKFIALIFLFPFLTNCAAEVEEADEFSSECSAYLEALSNTPAEKLFKKQNAAGNPRFLGVYGYVLQFPGLETFTSEERDKIIDKSGYVVLKGTSDDISDAGCKKYQEQAQIYAERYNQLFLNDLNLRLQQ
ncbi:hypothetical protein [Parasphingorhabdus sp.]|uniref:hypothetical protein n=1 Tax=Parasphingorhabdus sp. TaxID=2709688 RepID=UPI0032ECB03D